MENLRSKQGYLCDMDGVIYHCIRLQPAVSYYVELQYREKEDFLSLSEERG